MSAASFREGEVLRGKYRVKRVLGSGGMGVVVLARHLRLDRSVAIKMLDEASARRPGAVARFAREARAAAKILSEHVVRVIDVDESDTGAPFMVMEYLEGRDLAAILRADGPLPVASAVGYVLEACEGLAEAHALGIVHRDLKPANLFVCKRPGAADLVKVLDFGISKVSLGGEDELGVTSPEHALGSPLYMSPEQIKSARDVDPRSDVWSLGVVLFELLSATPPFKGENASALAAAIASEPPRPLRAARPEVPADLERAIFRCLERDVAARFADVAELAHALAPFAEDGPTLADRVSSVLRATRSRPSSSQHSVKLPTASESRVTASVDAGDKTATLDAAVTPPTPRPSDAPPSPVPRPRRFARLAVAVLAATGLGIAIWLALPREQPPAQSLSPLPTPSQTPSPLPAPAPSPSPSPSPSTSASASTTVPTSPSTPPRSRVPKPPRDPSDMDLK